MKLDRIARSAFALLAASAAAGCGRVPPPAPAPAPPPRPAPVSAASDLRVGETAGSRWELKRCVVRNGAMEVVDLDYNTATGDSTVNGRLFREAFPVTAEHAMNARWFIDNEPIDFLGHRYVKYGLPRILGPADIRPLGSYQGVAVFVEPEVDPARPEVVYLPVNAHCEFQVYVGGETGSAVRG